MAQDDRAVTPSGEPIRVQVLSNDTDEDGDALSISAIDAPSAGGTVSLSGDRRSVLFTPAAGFEGTAAFRYTATDGAAASSAGVAIQVLASGTPAPTLPPAPRPIPAVGNRAPVGVADFYVSKGRLKVLAAHGVLRNDTDQDGDALRAILLSAPRHGTIDLKADGSFTYVPAVAFVGADSFTYAPSDGPSQSAPVKVAIQAASAPDTTPPIVTLAGGRARRLRALEAARGSAVDVLRAPGIVVTSGLKNVVLRLQRGDGKFWNGRAYGSAPFDLRTRLASRSLFLMAAAMPPASQAPAGSYKWTAIATDNAGNKAQATQSVTIDTTPPTVAITTPSAGAGGLAHVTRLGAVSGRAGEGRRISVSFRRADGQSWNGRSYQSAPFFRDVPVVGGAWSLPASALPSGTSLPPGRYTITARAQDEAGNTSTTTRAVVVESSPAS